MINKSTYSILINDGCHWQCPYCIVKNNDIDIEKTNYAKNLEWFRKNKDIEFLSFSGGGDPMWNMNEEKENFFKQVIKESKERGIEIEMHTSLPNSTKELKFDRTVYHLRLPQQIKHIQQQNNKIIRVVYVVDGRFTKEMIDEIYNEFKKSEIVTELSFRQGIDNNYKIIDNCTEYLRDGHKNKWHYIEQDDYNNYVVNGVTSTRYEDFKKENNNDKINK